MNILEALKTEASKLQKRLNSINSAIEVLGGKSSVSQAWQETACLRKCTGQEGEGAKGAVGEGEGGEEECLART